MLTPCSISEFLPLLLATSWELPLAHQTKLVTLLAAMLPSMVRSDQPDKIARLSRAIEGAGDCIVRLVPCQGNR